MADAAHGFEESGNGPIEDANTNAHSDTADGAPTANEDGEGDREHHADRGDEWIGKFFLPLDEKRRYVEAGAAESCDVLAKIGEIHLSGLDDFTVEIGGRLDEFGK